MSSFVKQLGTPCIVYYLPVRSILSATVTSVRAAASPAVSSAASILDIILVISIGITGESRELPSGVHDRLKQLLNAQTNSENKQKLFKIK